MTTQEITPENTLKFAAHALRILSMDAIQKAASGHPGMPMGMADIATVLWGRYLKFNPSDPDWLDRDRFILSNGHGSMLLYSLLHLSGFDLSMEDLRNFRQLNSKTPGHPELGHTAGVEVTTGPLGQGIANGVGMALAERWLAERFNRPGHEMINHFTYAFTGDGCLMEGISHEACSLAGHLGLGKLIILFDDNQISIDGELSMTCSDDTLGRFTAYGWQVLAVDGHDAQALAAAIEEAQKDAARPSLIACRTQIGYGSPNLAGTSKTHGSPLGEDEISATRKALGWEWPPFEVPGPVKEFWEQAGNRGREAQKEWLQRFETYQQAFPAEAAELERISKGEASQAWREPLEALREVWLKDPPESDATRSASGKVLEAIGMAHPDLLGGSADLTPSNNTRPKSFADISKSSYGGKYIRYGVREHGMAGIMNGLARHGGVVPYAGTFAVFSDYMRPSMRLSALMKLQVIYILTHDSIGLGEDGPTHQPVEHYAALRAIPNMRVFRPADIRETLESWEAALNRKEGPSVLLLTRQKVPTLPGSGQGGVARGGYVMAESPPEIPLKLLLLATGSEVHLALEAQKELEKERIGARVVSLPCWEIFDSQPEDYREKVLPSDITCRVAVEAGVGLGWERYIGLKGRIVCMNSFGGSAPAQQLYQQFGITVEAVVRAAKGLVG